MATKITIEDKIDALEYVAKDMFNCVIEDNHMNTNKAVCDAAKHIAKKLANSEIFENGELTAKDFYELFKFVLMLQEKANAINAANRAIEHVKFMDANLAEFLDR